MHGVKRDPEHVEEIASVYILPGNKIPNREWTQAWKRTTAMSRL